jgi:hypothetical protein
MAIDRRACHGYGEIRVKFDDGRDVTFLLFAHGLSSVQDEESSEAAKPAHGVS